MRRNRNGATRAGAAPSPAFAYRDALALAALMALLAAGPGSATPAAAASPRWGWGMAADSTAAAADSSRARAASDSLRARLTADSARTRVSADSLAARPRAAAVDSSAREVDYLWVVRTALTSPSRVDEIVAQARSLKLRGLLVQVVGRGDAYYRSDLVPRAEALPRDDFDPLGRLIEAAHAAGIEVHAWMNCMLVWSAEHPPRDPRHVVREHPEWVARLKDGRSLARLTPRQRSNLGLEGVFLAPAHPGVRTWLARVAQEIVARYPVDGVQLDYIRQPLVAVGWDPTTRARFAMEAEVDPAHFDRLPRPERARIDSLWLEFQCAQVRAAVAEVRDSIHAARPGVSLSAAVIADTLTAERQNAQRWRSWLRNGLLDRAFVMCYAEPVQTVLDQLVGYASSLGADGRVVPGIAVYNTTPAAAAAKIKGARALGYPTLALYSYDALESRPGYWGRLRALLEPVH